jgi:ketosteroid isomerase-like protein
MRHSAEAVALTFVKAINRHDVDALAALMTPEHRSVDSLGKMVEGRDNARAVWVGCFRMVPDYAISLEETVCSGPVVILLGGAQGTYTPDGWLKAENSWETPAAFRAVIKDGKVSEWRVYADNEPMKKHMKGSM